MTQKLKTSKMQLMKELAVLGGMIRGSIVTGMKKCGRKDCKCELLNKAIHPYRILTTTIGLGKTRITYIKGSEEQLFSNGVKQ